MCGYVWLCVVVDDFVLVELIFCVVEVVVVFDFVGELLDVLVIVGLLMVGDW